MRKSPFMIVWGGMTIMNCDVIFVCCIHRWQVSMHCMWSLDVSVFSCLYDGKVYRQVMLALVSNNLESETRIYICSSKFLYWRRCARFGQPAPPSQWYASRSKGVWGIGNLSGTAVNAGEYRRSDARILINLHVSLSLNQWSHTILITAILLLLQ